MYGLVEGFKTYHGNRGRDVSGFEDDDISASLVVATEWIDARFRKSFPGLKVGLRDQIDEWPRQGGTDIYGYSIASDSVPNEVINATYEAALRQLQSPGSLSVDWTPPKYRRASVDGAVSVEYSMFSNAGDAQTRFQIIDEIISPVLTGRGDASPLSGGSIRV